LGGIEIVDEIERIKKGLQDMDLIDVFMVSENKYGVKFRDSFVVLCGIDYALVIGRSLEDIKQKLDTKEYSYG
jgi:hypothetical protein